MVQAQTCHRLRGREGYKQSILRLPADNSQAHPYHHTTNAAGTDLPTQSQGLGIVNLFLHVHTHVCMCAQVCAYKCKIRLHIFRCIYINTYIYIYNTYIYIYHNGWIRGMEQRYGTDPSRRYGTGVWNGGMERVWSRSLFRTSYFDLHPYVYTHIHTYTPLIIQQNHLMLVK